ncbi:MAG: serine hydrolase [Eubacterium sp.]
MESLRARNSSQSDEYNRTGSFLYFRRELYPSRLPGEYMSYSNEGYALLSYVVDQAAGIPLEEFLEKRIFEPLGMTRSVMDADAGRAKIIAGENITSLFDRDDDGKRYCNDDWSVIPPFRGSACVKSTASDMSKYYQMLSSRGVFEQRRIVPAEAVKLMIGSEFPLTDKPYYCLGLEKRRMEGKVVCEHAGALHGISGRGGMLEDGYAAVVLCNEGEVDVQEFLWACWNYILDIPYEKRHDWAIPDGSRFSRPELLVGDYVSYEGLPVHCIVKEENGELFGSYDGVPGPGFSPVGKVCLLRWTDNRNRDGFLWWNFISEMGKPGQPDAAHVFLL